MINFSKNLIALRQKNNLTQNELANKLGITRQTLSNYENGTRLPDLLILSKLALTFNCSIDNLVFNNLNKNKNIFDINISSRLYENLNKEKNYYLDLQKEIKVKLKEIEIILSFLNKLKTDSSEEYAEELVPEIENTIDLEPSYKKEESFLERYLTKLTENENLSQNFIPVNVVGSVKCGSPAYAYEEVTSTIALPAKYKDCYLLRADGDSMNKLFHDGELIVCCQNKIPHNNDIVVAYIPEHEEATCKKLKCKQQALELHPCSTMAYEIQRYDENSDVQIMAVVLGSLSDILEKENIDINELEKELGNYS